MTTAPSVRRTGIVPLTLAVAVGLSIASCTGSGAATAAPTASVVGVATATPGSSPTIAGGTPTPRVPATVEVDDPDLRMILPEGWAAYPMETYRALIESFAKGLTPEMQASVAEHLKAIDAGAVRIAAGGPIGGANASLLVEVDSGDRSLEAAVTRLRHVGMTTDSTLVDERPVTLATGKAVRRVETHAVPAGFSGVPSRTVEYITRLDDGRTLWILGTGPAAAPTFEALIDASVMSLRSR